jgi:6-phosphogluconolactonase
VTAIRVLPDSRALAEAAARHVVESLQTAIDRRGRASLALSGGSTPRDLHQRLANPQLINALDWSKVHIFFGDERCVPPDDERSNYGMAKAALLDRIDGPPPRVERIKGELGPDDGATDYEARLGEALGEGVPALDLILLGLGSDGHCASLFPGRPEVAVTDRFVVGVPEAGLEPFVPRVSFTVPTINAGREVVFLVTGAGKAEAAARAWGGPPDPGTPASLVAPASGTLTVLIDPAAAERLPEAGA